ncbi:MAG: aminotransferase class III-fold pyridoxal phosphate-dependent enzyme [Acidimicrobiales bacterium]
MSVQRSVIVPSAEENARPRDAELRARARAVIPGGMYGHMNMSSLPAEYPQFFASGRGARVVDVDGREFVDLMCSWGPVLLGHQNLEVEEAVARQNALGDCLEGPSERMVELAERLVAVVSHADWAMFEKNGTDATTLCCTIARAATGKKKILVARGAYHGSAPWCTPNETGTTSEDRANLVRYTYNDMESVREAFSDDVAGVLVSPFRHDAGFDQEFVDPAFAKGLRELCDARGAALILDDVRCGLRINFGGSWEPVGVEPDLSAWSKAIANGYPMAAVLGSDRMRAAAASLFTTGSFWFSSVPMAASLATLAVLERDDSVGHMRAMGDALRAGLAEQSQRWGIEVLQSGPSQMPYMSFVGDVDRSLANQFAASALRHGLFLHPRHNWFVSAAMTDTDLDVALSATEAAFSELRG